LLDVIAPTLSIIDQYLQVVAYLSGCNRVYVAFDFTGFEQEEQIFLTPPKLKPVQSALVLLINFKESIKVPETVRQV